MPSKCEPKGADVTVDGRLPKSIGLTKAQIKDIVKLKFKGLAERAARQDLQLTLTDKALEAIADGAYQPEFGARPIQRYLERNVERPLSHAILSGEVSAAKPVVIDYDGNVFTVK